MECERLPPRLEASLRAIHILYHKYNEWLNLNVLFVTVYTSLVEPVPYSITCRSLAWKTNGRPHASKNCMRGIYIIYITHIQLIYIDDIHIWPAYFEA